MLINGQFSVFKAANQPNDIVQGPFLSIKFDFSVM